MTKLIAKINAIPKKYFSIADLKKISDLNTNSLNVTVNRLIKKGILKRVKRGLYSTDPAKIDKAELACEIYGPSYLSFEWVLAKYGILSQQPANLTLATSRISKRMDIIDNTFFYHHLSPKMFWGYAREDNYLQSSPAKAWLDLAYLSLNGYAKLDLDEMNLSLINKKDIAKYLKIIGDKRLSNLVSNLLYNKKPSEERFHQR